MAHELSEPQKTLIRAIAAGLQAPRNRFGKLECGHTQYGPVDKAADDLGLRVRLPNGGVDYCDHVAMLLQALIDDKPTSMWKGLDV